MSAPAPTGYCDNHKYTVVGEQRGSATDFLPDFSQS